MVSGGGTYCAHVTVHFGDDSPFQISISRCRSLTCPGIYMYELLSNETKDGDDSYERLALGQRVAITKSARAANIKSVDELNKPSQIYSTVL